MEISLGVIFRGFNASKFLLYGSLLAFLILLSLNLDNRLRISYFFVFLPLWFCHFMVFAGAIIGVISFCARPPGRNDILIRNDFTAMVLTSTEHIFLVVFECFTCYNMEFGIPNGEWFPWTVVFTPLFVLSVVSLIIAVWALKHEKSFEFEFFYAINVIEFFFVAFKLDQQIDWSWAVVFIPLWVVLSLSAIGVLYALVLSIVLSRSRHMLASQRRQHFYLAVLHTFLVIPTLASLILLTNKLDAIAQLEKDKDPAHRGNLPYTVVFCPLMISLAVMMVMAFGNGGGNVWWFGMRRPFCTFILDSFPCMRQYANVSYKIGRHRRQLSSISINIREEADRPLRPVVPVTTIECPD